jgi:hypothetical protein
MTSEDSYEEFGNALQTVSHYIPNRSGREFIRLQRLESGQSQDFLVFNLTSVQRNLRSVGIISREILDQIHLGSAVQVPLLTVRSASQTAEAKGSAGQN